jgi:hypothetical protein
MTGFSFSWSIGGSENENTHMVECLGLVGYASNLVNLVSFFLCTLIFSIFNINALAGLSCFTSLASCPSYGDQE